MGGYTYNAEYEEVVLSSMGSASTALESLKSIASGISIPSDFTHKSALEKIIADISSFDLNETINTMASSMLSFMQSEMTASELANKDGYITYYELVAQMHQNPKQKPVYYTKKEKPKKTKYEEMWDRANKSAESARKALSESMEVYNDHKKIYDEYTLEKGKIGIQEFFWNIIDMKNFRKLQDIYGNNPTKADKDELMNIYLNSQSKKLKDQSIEADEKYMKEHEKFTYRNKDYLEKNKDYFDYGLENDLKGGRISEASGKYLPIVAIATGISFGATAAATPLLGEEAAAKLGFWASAAGGSYMHGMNRGMEATTGYIYTSGGLDVDVVDNGISYGHTVAGVTMAVDMITTAASPVAHGAVSQIESTPIRIIASAGTQAAVADVGYLAGVAGTTYAASVTDNKNYFVDFLDPEVQELIKNDLIRIALVNAVIGAGWGASDTPTNTYNYKNVKNDTVDESVANSYSNPNIIEKATDYFKDGFREGVAGTGKVFEKLTYQLDKDTYDITYCAEAKYDAAGSLVLGFDKNWIPSWG